MMQELKCSSGFQKEEDMTVEYPWRCDISEQDF